MSLAVWQNRVLQNSKLDELGGSSVQSVKGLTVRQSTQPKRLAGNPEVIATWDREGTTEQESSRSPFSERHSKQSLEKSRETYPAFFISGDNERLTLLISLLFITPFGVVVHCCVQKRLSTPERRFCLPANKRIL